MPESKRIKISIIELIKKYLQFTRLRDFYCNQDTFQNTFQNMEKGGKI